MYFLPPHIHIFVPIHIYVRGNAENSDGGGVRMNLTPHIYILVPLHIYRCGVTPQTAIMEARLPLVITHAPGHMFVTDLLTSEIMQRY